MNNHPLVSTLRGLHGNPRSAVFTEPLWVDLYAAYASVYMLALDWTIRSLACLPASSWEARLFFSLLSGAITDELGR